MTTITASPTLGPTPRTKVRRLPQRASYDAALVHAILDEALVAHVGFVDANGQPMVIPINHWRVGDQLYFHGASTSRLLKAMLEGTVCVTVTLIDGLVMAKSAFHHSVNYRSVVLFAQGRLVTEADELAHAVDALIDKLQPGRAAQVRAPNATEWNATRFVALPICEASAKLRQGPPADEAEDLALPVWSGVVPLALTRGEPEPA